MVNITYKKPDFLRIKTVARNSPDTFPGGFDTEAIEQVDEACATTLSEVVF